MYKSSKAGQQYSIIPTEMLGLCTVGNEIVLLNMGTMASSLTFGRKAQPFIWKKKRKNELREKSHYFIFPKASYHVQRRLQRQSALM